MVDATDSKEMETHILHTVKVSSSIGGAITDNNTQNNKKEKKTRKIIK